MCSFVSGFVCSIPCLLHKVNFKTKILQEIKRVIHNDNRINSSRGYNNFKYVLHNDKFQKYMQQKLTELKGEIDLQLEISILLVADE